MAPASGDVPFSPAWGRSSGRTEWRRRGPSAGGLAGAGPEKRSPERDLFQRLEGMGRAGPGTERRQAETPFSKSHARPLYLRADEEVLRILLACDGTAKGEEGRGEAAARPGQREPCACMELNTQHVRQVPLSPTSERMQSAAATGEPSCPQWAQSRCFAALRVAASDASEEGRVTRPQESEEKRRRGAAAPEEREQGSEREPAKRPVGAPPQAWAHRPPRARAP